MEWPGICENKTPLLLKRHYHDLDWSTELIRIQVDCLYWQKQILPCATWLNSSLITASKENTGPWFGAISKKRKELLLHTWEGISDFANYLKPILRVNMERKRLPIIK